MTEDFKGFTNAEAELWEILDLKNPPDDKVFLKRISKWIVRHTGNANVEARLYQIAEKI